MGKTRGVHETTPELRNRMVGMYEAGLGLREIATAVNCSPRTVKRWLNRFDKEGTVETRERCGRKRATTTEQDEAIVRLATQTPIAAAKVVLPALGLTCSVDTIRERLHKAGIHNWSPSRKYMQRIPLGNTIGVTIQQPVWRPTGTQLGKKKSFKELGKSERNTSVTKKKVPPIKIKIKDEYVGDGAPVENVKSSNEQHDFMYQQQNVSQSHTSTVQAVPDPLQQQSQTEFGTHALTQQPQPTIYQHSTLHMSYNWSLDLVQPTHHYPQRQPNAMSQVTTTHQLEDIDTPQEQQHHVQQTITEHIHKLEEPESPLHQVQQQHHNHLNAQLASAQTSTNLTSDNSNTCTSQDNNQSSSIESDQSTDTKREDCTKTTVQKKEKKGGKAKGTLETSVEIRNRMIGMSEAGLSTLSIALAIDRSERTVKRWLERWHKEGNVQTKERKGRRRITTKEQDEAIIAMATQQPLTAAKHVAPALGLKCSVDTIRERLHKAGIHSWKLGKKQGEGNAVHTVHLWQPSGNRSSKPKLAGEKRKRSNSSRKRSQVSNNTQRQLASKKIKPEFTSMKAVPFTANVMPEQIAALPFHNSGSGSNIIQSVHNVSAPSPIIQSQTHPPEGPSQAPEPMQQIGPLMQQRPDCRLAPAIVTPVSIQGNAAITYPSCMVVATNTHTGHMEQPDPLNYEPYIWTF